MINKEKWVRSLPAINNFSEGDLNQLDHNKWISTISKKNVHNSFKKYTFCAILFVCGLLLVSALKNETRNLQKEINSLEASINHINFNLSQAILDHEVITSPENISNLATQHLDINLITYKKSQIINLNDEIENLNKKKIASKNTITKKINKNLTNTIKAKMVEKVEEKKMEIQKLQELYSNPKTIPKEMKTQVAKKIKEKKVELKNIYNSPQDLLTLERMRKWGAVQVVKLFLGIPIVPGR